MARWCSVPLIYEIRHRYQDLLPNCYLNCYHNHQPNGTVMPCTKINEYQYRVMTGFQLRTQLWYMDPNSINEKQARCTWLTLVRRIKNCWFQVQWKLTGLYGAHCQQIDSIWTCNWIQNNEGHRYQDLLPNCYLNCYHNHQPNGTVMPCTKINEYQYRVMTGIPIKKPGLVHGSGSNKYWTSAMTVINH